MIRKIINYISEDGWKWAVVVFALSAVAAVGNAWLITGANIEAAHDSFGLSDCLFEMEEIDHALEQLGAGEIGQARWILEARLDSMRAKVMAQMESTGAAERATALMGLMRVAQSQQTHPDYYSTGWPVVVSDADKRIVSARQEHSLGQADIQEKAKKNN